MLEKFNTPVVQHWIKQLKDVRILGFLVFGVIVLLVSWNTVGVIQANYELQKKIARVQQQNQVSELENTNLKLRNEYYNTEQYLELTARKQFGKAAPGEQVYIIPKDVALAHTVDPSGQAAETEATPEPKPTYQRNFEAWVNFFLHRPNPES